MNDEHTPTGREGVSTTGGTAVFDRPSGEDLDALFGVLADEQRRRVLAHLDRRDGDVVAFSDLVDAIAGEDGDPGPDEGGATARGNDGTGVPADDRERIAMRLHHAHLPKLEDAGLVEFDARSETVRYRGGPVASSWIDLARGRESDAGR